jgi:DNA primase
MADVCEQIKERLDILDIVSEYVELKKAGNSLKGLCPFHSEKTPSFTVNQQKQIFHCFGCGAGGDVIHFVMKIKDIEFPEALKILAEKADVKLDEGNGKYSRLFEINAEALRFYESNLRNNSKAMKYLTGPRGLTQESIEKFHLGCADGPSLKEHLKGKGYSEDEMLVAGLVVNKENEIRDFFWKRIMFPIISRGKVKAFGGRAVGESEVKYLNSPETAVFKKGELLYGLDSHAIKERGFAIVVEGYVDVIMWHQHGYRNTVAPLGTALSLQHIELLKKYTDTMIPIFDGDKAGQAAAMKTTKMLFDQRVKGYAAELPDGEDPDSYLRKGNSPEALLDSALPFGVFLLKHNLKGTRRMLFNEILSRGTVERVEYLSFAGNSEEIKASEEMEARVLLEKALARAPIVLRQNGVEIRKYEGCLAVIADGRYRMKQEMVKDYKAQAQELLKFIFKLKRNTPAREKKKA